MMVTALKTSGSVFILPIKWLPGVEFDPQWQNFSVALEFMQWRIVYGNTVIISVGNMIGDQISGWGLLTSYNWSLANGVVGLLAGLAPLYLASWLTGSVGRKAAAGAIAGAIAVVVGLLIVFSDIPKDGLDFNGALGEYVPAVVGDVIATIILVPILVYAWEPVRERLGR